jgi:biotin operon repressor
MTIEQQEPRGLSEAELEALTILNENMAALRASGIKVRKRKKKQIRKNKKIIQQNCVLAVRLLDEIGQKRSHGYRLSEATSLNQETRKLEGIRRTNCRP